MKMIQPNPPIGRLFTAKNICDRRRTRREGGIVVNCSTAITSSKIGAN